MTEDRTSRRSRNNEVKNCQSERCYEQTDGIVDPQSAERRPGSAGDEQDGGLDKSIAGKEEEETTTATATAM